MAANPEQDAAARAEEDEKALVEWLEMLKVVDPPKYQQLMAELAASAPDGFKPVVPGGDGKVRMGSSGLETDDEGVIVEPKEGFVIKTTYANAADKRKVFINIVQSDLVGKPAPKTKLDDEGNEQQGMNIPLSLGPPRPDKDRAGGDCVVFDIIVHPDVITDIKADPTGTARHFLCTLAINYVEQKYKAPLVAQYKLPNMKYKGSKLETQRVRAKKAPIIEEVPSAGSSAATRPAAASGAARGAPAASPSAKPPAAPAKMKPVPIQHARYSVAYAAAETGPLLDAPPSAQSGWAVVTFFVPALGVDGSEPASIQVGAAEELLTLSCDAYKLTEVLLPVRVQSASTGGMHAKFSTATRELVVWLPLLGPSPSDAITSYAPDVGSKPWLLANALHDEEGEDSKPGVTGAKPSTALRPLPPPAADDELPEDRFHRADIVSTHLLMQKAKDLAEAKKRKEEQEAEKAKARAAGGAAAAGGLGGGDVEELSVEDVMRKDGGPVAPAAPFVDDGGAITPAGAFDLL